MLEEKKYDFQSRNRLFPFEEMLTIKSVRQQIRHFFSLNGYKRFYDKKNTIFQVNDLAHEGYIVENGRVRTYKITPEGKEVTFNILNTGEMLGMAEIVLGCPRKRYAETMCKTTLLAMNKEQLFSLFFSNSEFCFNQLWLSTTRMLSYQNVIEDLVFLPVRDRVVKMLVRLCKEKGKQTEKSTIIDFPITHEEIAQMVGSSRQTVTYILNELRKEGIISWEQKKIKILRWMDLIDHF